MAISKFLSQHSRLRPANRVKRREAVVVDDAKVAARVLGDFARVVSLEAKHDFQEAAYGRRSDGKMKYVAFRFQHARQFP